MAQEADKDEVEVTPEIIEAKIAILEQLEGEVSKQTLADQLYRAMAKLRPSPRQLDGCIALPRSQKQE